MNGISTSVGLERIRLDSVAIKQALDPEGLAIYLTSEKLNVLEAQLQNHFQDIVAYVQGFGIWLQNDRDENSCVPTLLKEIRGFGGQIEFLSERERRRLYQEMAAVAQKNAVNNTELALMNALPLEGYLEVSAKIEKLKSEPITVYGSDQVVPIEVIVILVHGGSLVLAATEEAAPFNDPQMDELLHALTEVTEALAGNEELAGRIINPLLQQIVALDCKLLEDTDSEAYPIFEALRSLVERIRKVQIFVEHPELFSRGKERGDSDRRRIENTIAAANEAWRDHSMTIAEIQQLSPFRVRGNEIPALENFELNDLQRLTVLAESFMNSTDTLALMIPLLVKMHFDGELHISKQPLPFLLKDSAPAIEAALSLYLITQILRHACPEYANAAGLLNVLLPPRDLPSVNSFRAQLIEAAWPGGR